MPRCHGGSTRELWLRGVVSSSAVCGSGGGVAVKVAMTVAPYDIDPARFLEEHLAQASPDLLREMLGAFINQLLSADADQVCGAACGAVSEDRVNRLTVTASEGSISWVRDSYCGVASRDAVAPAPRPKRVATTISTQFLCRILMYSRSSTAFEGFLGEGATIVKCAVFSGKT